MNNKISSEYILNSIKNDLIDPLAKELANEINWCYIDGISEKKSDLYPVAVLGNGPPLLMLHGFDSCFLEFRRIAPLLKDNYKLIIPDLYGFGFSPRSKSQRYEYRYEDLISHLVEVLNLYSNNIPIGIIGASMGGAIAMELGRKMPSKINRLLLLSPAGLHSIPKRIQWPMNYLGTYFLKQNFVRKSLCRKAFADPSKSVGLAEEQIASIHLKVDGWQKSLAEFAKSGGISNYGKDLPPQPIDVIWGAQDRIINKNERIKSMIIIGKKLNELENCGHLPHLDNPKYVANYWQRINETKRHSTK